MSNEVFTAALNSAQYQVALKQVAVDAGVACMGGVVFGIIALVSLVAFVMVVITAYIDRIRQDAYAWREGFVFGAIISGLAALVCALVSGMNFTTYFGITAQPELHALAKIIVFQ
jgi:hypothetical protein